MNGLKQACQSGLMMIQSLRSQSPSASQIGNHDPTLQTKPNLKNKVKTIIVKFAGVGRQVSGKLFGNLSATSETSPQEDITGRTANRAPPGPDLGRGL